MLNVHTEDKYVTAAGRPCRACGYEPSEDDVRRWLAAMLITPDWIAPVTNGSPETKH